LWCAVALILACLCPVRTARAQSSGFEVRDASGTAWVPDDTPMHGAVRSLGDWQIMLHGNAVIQVVGEPNDRHRTGGDGHYQASSANWFMAMARRPAGQGRFGLRAALSAEPWTVGSCGFLNLLATGEMCDGDTIHDRQHPHDLFMELAADYDGRCGGRCAGRSMAAWRASPRWGRQGFRTGPRRCRIRSRRSRTTGWIRRTSPSVSSPPACKADAERRRSRRSTPASRTRSAAIWTSAGSTRSPVACRGCRRRGSCCRCRPDI